MTDAQYRWVIVAAGALLGCVAAGAMFSLPVLLSPMTEATGWSRAGLSMAMTIGFLAMAVGSITCGTISDRVGPKAVVLGGSILLAVSLALASYSRSLIEFQIVFGLFVGLGTSAIFTPLMATVAGWFETRTALAVSLVSVGIGVAPMTMSPLVAWLITQNDWRATLLIVAGIVAVTMIPTAFFIRRPPALEQKGAPQEANAATVPEMSLGEAIKSRPFIILLLTNFFCCATHSGPIIHTVSYAISCGLPMMAAVSIYSLEGLAGLAGRVGFGVLGDKFGAKRILVIGLLAQAFGAFGYYFARTLPEFYAIAAIFGFIYAGVMPLYAVIVRENFPLGMMGTIIGGMAMAGSVGMATGPVLGGWIYDGTGSYGGLYIVSFGMGIGAALIALTFPKSKSTA
jgi:MFS family permease